ncbi:MAG: hypothetical protein AABY10_06120 [Nanoarchaeota archaeon]
MEDESLLVISVKRVVKEESRLEQIYAGPGTIGDWEDFVPAGYKREAEYRILNIFRSVTPNRLDVEDYAAKRVAHGKYNVHSHQRINLFGSDIDHLVRFLRPKGERR